MEKRMACNANVTANSGRVRFPLSAFRFVAFILVAGATGGAAGLAGEIQLHADGSSSGGIVHLGDVAAVYVTDETQRDALRAIELFPAPAAGSSRSVRAREIQDLLVLRGVNLGEHRLSGASQVDINVAAVTGTNGGTGLLKAVTSQMEHQAGDAVRAAIAQYVAAQTNTDDFYDVNVTLDDAQIRVLSSVGYKLVVSGGAQPWTGSQRFTIGITVKKVQSFVLDAVVRPTPTAVVAVHSIARGAVVQDDDIKLQHVRASADSADVYDRLVAVVGQETTRPISAGQFVDRDSIRSPVYVRKGDAVTVYARSAGLRVRTTARAGDDGSLGDLIKVESMLNRQTLFARVIGPQEVEIYARAPDTGANTRPQQPVRKAQ
jgi:flagella basal body P-ring formation protein FlgA